MIDERGVAPVFPCPATPMVARIRPKLKRPKISFGGAFAGKAVIAVISAAG